MKSPELIVIGGKPFSGKSTIAKAYTIIEKRRVVKHLSMGERLRAISKGHIESLYSDELVASEKELKSHAPVIDKNIPRGVFQEFIEEDPADLVLLDGLPRHPERMTGFLEAAQNVGVKVIAVCRVNVSDEVVHARNPSRPQRYDDVVEDRDFIDRRLADFHTGASLVLDMLSTELPYYELDGTKPIRENVTALRGIYLAHSECS